MSEGGQILYDLGYVRAQSCPILCHPMDCSPLCPLWNFSGKNTGVGCHSLPQGIFPTQGSILSLPLFRQILYHLSHQGSHAAAAAAKSLQSCPTLCDPIDGSPPGFPIPGILQARTLEWVAIPFPRGSSQRRDQIQVSLQVILYIICLCLTYFTNHNSC